MKLITWEKPGTRLRGEFTESLSELESIFMNMESCLIEANIAYNRFSDPQNGISLDLDGQHFKMKITLRSQAERQIATELGEPDLQKLSGSDANAAFHERNRLIDRRTQELLIESGQVPSSYQLQIRLLYAKSYVHSIATFNNFLKVISENPIASPGLGNIHEKFKRKFPFLVEVRNSVQHVEDRIRRRGRNGKKYETTLNLIAALSDNRFVVTIADGSDGEVPISLEGLTAMQKSLTDVYAIFDWTGPRRQLPS